jgi:hypothetical protein
LQTQALLRALFGMIVDDDAILPPPSPTPSTETTTPPPTETTTPPPTETTTPPPTETQSESLVLIPFAFTLMLAISGWARRRSHRSADGPD